MTVPTISNLPTVPATSDPNFETEAPALFNHIKNTFVSEMNSAISFINSSTFDATVEFKDSNFTAARNFLYMIDTSSAAVSVTLPANPSTGDQLLLMDQKRSFGTNNLTIVRNGQNINGAASNVVSKSTGALIRCIFQASYGWTVDLYEGEWESGTSAGDLVYTGGNVGIGTSAPTGKLDVNTGVMSGDVKIGNFDNVNNGNNTAQFGNGTKLEFIADTNPKYAQHDPYTVGYIKAEYSGSGADTTSGDTDLVFATYDGFAGSANGVLSDKMRITADGKVGIGTSSPKGNLDVSGVIEAGTDSSISGSTMLRNRYVGNDYTCNFGAMQSSGAGMIGYAVAPKNGSAGFVSSADVANFARAALEISHDLKYSTATNQSTTVGDDVTLDTKFIVKNDGKVGIGTSSPQRELTIGDGTTSPNILLYASAVGNSRIEFGDPSDQDAGEIQYDHSTNHMNFSTNGVADRMVLDDNGNVGIGTSSPSAPLHVKADNNIIMSLQSSDATVGNLYFNFRNDDGDEKGWIGYGSSTTDDFGIFNNQSRDLNIGTSGSTRLQIKSAGDVEVKTGNLVIGTAGKGIDFSANSHASGMSSELLTDYEEGTWTPVVADASSGGNTATGNFSGTYTKVGRIVTVHCYALDINTTGLTSTNSIVVRGLPFTNGDTIAKYGSIRLQSVTFSGYCVAQLGGSSSSVSIIENKSGISNSNVTVGDLNSGVADILFSLTYQS